MRNLFFILLLFSCSSQNTNKQTFKKSDSINVELYSLKAKVEDLNNKYFILNEQLDTLRARIATNFKTVNKLEEEEEVLKNVDKFNTSNASIKKAYYDAYKFYANNQFAKSLLAFSSFVEKYPNTSLTDNAYFWIGESYYKQAEYKLAIDEFLKVVEKFPDGSKAPDAMLRIANSYEFLNKKEDAISYYKELINKFENSKSAMAAKTALEKIKG